MINREREHTDEHKRTFWRQSQKGEKKAGNGEDEDRKESWLLLHRLS